MKSDPRVEIEAAEALLDVGVSLPLFRIPFTRRALRLTMKRPCLGSQIRLLRLYRRLGATYDEIVAFTRHEELCFMARQGRRLSKMVALTILRGPVSGLFAGVLAWLLRWFVPEAYIRAAGLQFLRLAGTKSFLTIINSVEAMNPMKPRLSHRQKGS